MTREEHETVLNYDYAAGLIRVYTTRESVYNGFRHRLGAENVTDTAAPAANAWAFTVPMALCRKPEALAKLLNPDAKTPMSAETKARFASPR